MQHPAPAFAIRSAALHVPDAVGVPHAHPVPARVLARVLVSVITRVLARVLVSVLARVLSRVMMIVLARVLSRVLARAGILVQAAVDALVLKIQAPALGVELIAMELVLVAVGLALVVRVLIQYMVHIDFLGGKNG